MSLGRTNEEFPNIWLSLSLPEHPEEIKPLVDAALEGQCPIDVSSQPGLWGHYLRGTAATVMTIGGDEIKNATSEKHAAELTEAHFIQSLCAIGRDYLDFYFLRIGSHLSEAQINGALRALSSAKDEGNLRFIGIAAETDPGVVLTLWQFHDAFEVALTPRNHRIREPFEMLEPFAQQRRVGLITSRPFNWGYGLPFVALPSVWRLRNLTQSFYGLTLAQAVLQDLAKNHPVLVGVRSAKEVQSALTACQTPAPAGIEAVLDLFKEAFDRDSDWAELAAHPAAHVREAVERRVHDLQRV